LKENNIMILYMNKVLIQQVAIISFFMMFIYSGVMKIIGFTKKTKGLEKKTGLPFIINQLGMVSVILLEIFGSLLILAYFLGNPLGSIINKDMIKLICQIYMLFMVVVTFLYHPPTDKLIPFLSNVTTFGGLLLIYNNV
tara:strand:- start:1355 stop:1771 length:417 start_codon:yes stop_codon:yes gene_type:complete